MSKDTKRINISMSSRHLVWLDAICRKLHVSRSELIQTLIELYAAFYGVRKEGD